MSYSFMIKSIKYYLFISLLLCAFYLEQCLSEKMVMNEGGFGYCAPYNGKVCKSHITSTQVWYSRVSEFPYRMTFLLFARQTRMLINEK